MRGGEEEGAAFRITPLGDHRAGEGEARARQWAGRGRGGKNKVRGERRRVEASERRAQRSGERCSETTGRGRARLGRGSVGRAGHRGGARRRVSVHASKRRPSLRPTANPATAARHIRQLQL